MWGGRDSNPQPIDYAYHFSFHCPFRVCGLDFTFILSNALRQVSTPSSCDAWLGITISKASPNLKSFSLFLKKPNSLKNDYEMNHNQV